MRAGGVPGGAQASPDPCGLQLLQLLRRQPPPGGGAQLRGLHCPAGRAGRRRAGGRLQVMRASSGRVQWRCSRAVVRGSGPAGSSRPRAARPGPAHLAGCRSPPSSAAAAPSWSISVATRCSCSGECGSPSAQRYLHSARAGRRRPSITRAAILGWSPGPAGCCSLIAHHDRAHGRGLAQPVPRAHLSLLGSPQPASSSSHSCPSFQQWSSVSSRSSSSCSRGPARGTASAWRSTPRRSR